MFSPTFLKSRKPDILINRRNVILESAEKKTRYPAQARVLSIPSSLKERGKMSRQQRLIQVPLVGAILLCLLVGLYLLAWKRFSKPDPTSTIIRHTVETHPDDALKYWTADKKRKAKPARLPHVNALDQGEKHPRRPPDSSSRRDA